MFLYYLINLLKSDSKKNLIYVSTSFVKIKSEYIHFLYIKMKKNRKLCKK